MAKLAAAAAGNDKIPMPGEGRDGKEVTRGRTRQGMIAYIRRTAQDLREEGMLSVSERAKKAEHLPKDRVALSNPRNNDLVRNAYENVLCLQMIPMGMRGMASALGVGLLGGVALGIYGVAGFWSFGIVDSVQKGPSGYAILGAMLIVAVVSVIITMLAFCV